jgi:hypothetical protein
MRKERRMRERSNKKVCQERGEKGEGERRETRDQSRGRLIEPQIPNRAPRRSRSR